LRSAVQEDNSHGVLLDWLWLENQDPP